MWTNRATGPSVRPGPRIDAVAVAVPVFRPVGVVDTVIAAISVVVSTAGAEPRALAAVLTCAARAISRALTPHPAERVRSLPRHG